MRILQICSARSIGGGERHVADLSNSLVRRGHEVFATLSHDSPLKKELAAIPSEHILFCGMRNSVDFVSALKLANFARKTQVDIIHAHIARDYPMTALAARLAEKPFVLTRHVLFPLKKIHKYVLKNVRGIIAPSKAVSEALENQDLFPGNKITIINNGIDLKHYAANKIKQNQTFTVGTIGHLAPIKGHDIFIRAADIVLKKHPDVRFLIAGEDKSADGKNRRDIENLIKELNLQKKIELKGWTDDIRPFLHSLDLFVSAARQEPFGLVMLEAMSSEIPVIASQSEGAGEIIENGKSGVIIPIEDFQILAEKILNLREDASKRRELGQAGKRRVEEKFSIEKMVDKIVDFYRSALQK